ncbi:hypothetical protein DFP73DRAFT_534297 [Morchella snyderi]|nr:hypothetical protein DFP73DRAFT_534297 [Morchella snyderi]
MAAYPPPHPLRDDTLDAAATTTSAKHSLPLPKAPDTVVVDDTASEEDPDPDDEDAPHYKPYHTQQLPSSFWQTNGAYTQLLQQGSQWAPDALRRKYSAAGHPSSSQRAAAPEIVQLPGGAGGPMKDVDVGVEEDVDVDVDAKEDGDEDEDGDGDEPSQFLPGPGDDGEREGEPPSSPVLPGCPEVPATPTQKVGRGRRRRRRRSGEFKLRSIPDDDEDVTIATSQLLPSELMETFPMPPPLSQFSSYGYGDLSFESESETQ